ncbi:hypothetical protein OC834_004743 [Tilletia horrida]|uniref:Uncharacterized protein n=1 Tax=Tilletia horrida TaxID=155126 RepID=A0AAN6GHJ0_9BASI|nr:hypothetical protein OC834_004743 [Tilletia horrida]KAK0530866.1 hypothetical protein OC835_003865 [Tilletia horrida]KAK0541158.1 hypothetical protein OC842_000117 [Tilletia horrida]KAK0565785.1 hypothetical protein OC844_001047 [Tilletia horrida]
MKSFCTTSVLVLAAASLVAADPVLHATPAPVKRQVIPTDFSQYTSFTNLDVLSSYYAQATSALSQAVSAGAPSSQINEERSSLDAAFSSAFAALSSMSKGGSSPSTSASAPTSSSGGGQKGAAAPGLNLDLPVSLAITGVAGLVAAVFAL